MNHNILKYRQYYCSSCDVRFEIKTDGTYAPHCRKCLDSEYVLYDAWNNVVLEEAPPKVATEEKSKETEEEKENNGNSYILWGG